jgi:hypothetical protein
MIVSKEKRQRQAWRVESAEVEPNSRAPRVSFSKTPKSNQDCSLLEQQESRRYSREVSSNFRNLC